MTLVDQHQAALRRLRTATSGLVGTAWDSLGSYHEADVAPFVARVTPIVVAAQRSAAALTAAYLARMLGAPPRLADLAAFTGAAVRNGTSPGDVYRRPFVTTWTALAAGAAWRDAVAAGGARARLAASTDVALAMRATYQGAQDANSRIRGYRRVTSGACAYCSEIDGAFVKSADAAPLHPGCGCDLEPVFYDAKPAALPEKVAVHEHGELGPVVGDAAHEFTSEDDI